MNKSTEQGISYLVKGKDKATPKQAYVALRGPGG
jgi:hypothetical protein